MYATNKKLLKLVKTTLKTNITYWFPANISLFNSRTTRKTCEICSKFSSKNDVIDVVQVFLLLTLNIFYIFFSSGSVVGFEQVNVKWVIATCNLSIFGVWVFCVHVIHKIVKMSLTKEHYKNIINITFKDFG